MPKILTCFLGTSTTDLVMKQFVSRIHIELLSTNCFSGLSGKEKSYRSGKQQLWPVQVILYETSSIFSQSEIQNKPLYNGMDCQMYYQHNYTLIIHSGKILSWSDKKSPVCNGSLRYQKRCVEPPRANFTRVWQKSFLLWNFLQLNMWVGAVLLNDDKCNKIF